MTDPELYAAIRQGCADMLWWMAWAGGMEEVGRSNELAGAEISAIAPPTPSAFVDFAQTILAALERRAYLGGPLSIEDALVAVSDDPGDDAQEFGESLAHEVQGSGVSWEDDHESHRLPVDQLHVECRLQGYGLEPYDFDEAVVERILDDGDVGVHDVYFGLGEY